MQTITLEIPDVIWKSHDQNISAVKEEMRRGLVIWEYLNGHLTIGECGEIQIGGADRYKNNLKSALAA